MSQIRRLRASLSDAEMLLMPGLFDASSARVLQQSGFSVGFMSGFAVSAARLGLPDTGLISFAEMLQTLRDCVEAAPDFPIMADADTGYGNALNVQRTVRHYAQAGAAAIMLEDQIMPKSCDNAIGKQVISLQEARLKIRAAVDAAAVSGMVVFARTDARTVLGFEEALARCVAFAEEGADVIFMDSPASLSELKTVCNAVQQPCMASVILGVTATEFSRENIAAQGVKFLTYPHAMLNASVNAMQRAAQALNLGDFKQLENALSFNEIKNFAGFNDYYLSAKKYS